MNLRPRRPALAALLAAALSCPLLAVSAPAAGAAPGDGPKKIKDQYIVTFKNAAADVEVAAAREDSRGRGAKVRHTYRHAVKGFAGTMSAAEAERLRKAPNVLAVEPDYEVRASNITQTPAGWGLDRLDQRSLPLSGAYGYGPDGAGVTAYVIDTGIRTTHSEFGGRAGSGFTAINDGQGSNDCNGHGTHVAATIGGSTYGVAKGVKLVAVRVLGCDGSGTTSGVIAGVDWVRAHASGPALVNMSLGGGASTALDNAIANSINSGVTYAVAAGNDNADACSYSPARLPAAITVGATTSTDARASFSNFGSCLDIFAPGQDIVSAVSGSDTATASYNGTSMASPHVAGVIANYLQSFPSATPAEVGSALLGAATPELVTDPGTGSPNQLLHSVLPAAGTTTPPPPPSSTSPPPTTSPPLAGDSPVSSAPTLLLNGAAGQLASSTAPVKISWAPATDADGIASYQLQRSTDGGSTWSTITLPSPTATSITLNQTFAASLLFRLRATDALGTVGAYATAAPFALSLVQQSASAVTYPAGSWATYSSSSASGGSYRRSHTAGSKVELTFTGTQVNWIGIAAPSRGKAYVYLDGVYQKTVDAYSSTVQYRRILFNKTVAAGKHTLEIRVLGTKNRSSSGTYVDADAFVTLS